MNGCTDCIQKTHICIGRKINYDFCTRRDGSGNFNLGLKEQLIFPEINSERVPKQRGMNISFVIDGGQDDLSLDLLREFGMPFKKSVPAATAGRN